jgi:hypothetical protein
MPRITITLTDHQHKLFQSLSKYTGKPMSGYISEMLHASTPVLERMAAVFQRLYEQQQKEKSRIVSEFEQIQDSLEPIASSMLNQFDMFLAKVVPGQAEQADDLPPAHVADVPAGRPFAPRPSPLTNRGDTPPLDKTPKALPNKAHRSVRPREVLKKNKGLNS